MSLADDGRARASFDLPADPDMWTLARMGVSAIATRLDFGIDDIEDLRLAVSELCSTCATGSTAASRMLLDCSWDHAAIEVRCTVSALDGDGLDPAVSYDVDLSQRILEALTDSHEIGKLAGGSRDGSFRKGREPAGR